MFERGSNRIVSSSRSGGAVHKLTHDWSISGYDFIKGYQIERFNSPPFKFYGFEWFIQFYPHGTSDNRENVAVFLIGKDLPKVEILCSFIQFAVINQKDDSKTLRPRPYYYVLSGKDTKHNHSNSGGHVNVMTSQDLHDSSNGFIGPDGTLKIRLELKISCLDPTLCPHTRDPRTGECRLSDAPCARTMDIRDSAAAQQAGLVPSMQTMLSQQVYTDVELRVRRYPHPKNSTRRTLFESPPANSRGERSPSLLRTDSPPSYQHRGRSSAPSAQSYLNSSQMSVDGESVDTLDMSLSSDSSLSPPHVNSASSSPIQRRSSPFGDSSPSAACGRGRTRAITSPLSLDDSDQGSPSNSHYSRRAHKCILASRSPVFRAMFSLRMRETVSNVVEIDDMRPQILDALLAYIYSDKAPNTSLAPELLAVADKYQMPGLLHTCECVLVHALTVENCLSGLMFADRYRICCPNLRENILGFICEKFYAVCKTTKFVEFMKTQTELAHEIICANACPLEHCYL